MEFANDTFAGAGDSLKVVGHAFGLTGGARGVHQHAGVGGRAGGLAFERLGACHHFVPGVKVVARGQRKGNALQARRQAWLLLRPGVELADKQQASFTVLEHIGNSLRCLGRKNRNRAAAGHPNGQLGHDEVRAVFRQNSDARARLDVETFYMRCHAPGLVQGLSPGVVQHRTAADGLGHVDGVWAGSLVLIDIVQQ